MYRYIAPLLLIGLFHCCRANKLETVLRLAGDNRGELERVLEHYSADKADSLKFKAALFLIENMPGHYSVAGENIADYYKAVDSVLVKDYNPERKQQLINNISAKYTGLTKNIIEDIKIITSDYLIRNIESAFNLWETKAWLEHVGFNEFCEYILPYKCAELQQLDGWRDTLSLKFNNAIEQLPFSDQYYNSSYYHCLLINEEIRNTVRPFLSSNFSSAADHLFYSASTIYKMPYGTCDEYNVLALSVMRSHGLPVVMDHFPMWGRLSPGHSWYKLLNNSGALLTLPWGIESNPGDVFFPTAPVPKIYRNQYGHNERMDHYKETAVYKIGYFNSFLTDVTSEYMKTSDISITIQTKNFKDNYAYIAVFDNKEWSVVDFGEIKKRKAYFSNMGRDIAYIVLGYNGTGLIPVSPPFILKSNGDIKYLIPDKSHPEDVRLTRKYPLGGYVAYVGDRILGGKIQASNKEDFSDYETLYTIDSLSYPDRIQLNEGKKYRYWRYYGADNSWCNIAEVQFYRAGCDTVAKGRIIGLNDIYYSMPESTADKAFDGDWLTIYHYAYESGGWVGMDFGEPVCIDRVRCVGRTDDNAIHYGDVYELKYWDDGAWQSLGRQTAQERFLLYDSVPDNALLLLNNHTRGKQERIFTYEKGRQVWW